jgi:uncharacterized protein involved in exopolysaccharide biosynthesis
MRVATRVVLVLIIAALAGAAALAFSKSQPKEYQSRLRFEYGRLVSPELQILGPGFAEPGMDENIRAQTEAAAVSSYNVAVATAKAAPNLGTPGQISAHVSAQAVRDTLTVELIARAPTPVGAAQLANTYAQAYLGLRRQRERRRAANAEDTLKKTLVQLPRVDRLGFPGQSLNGQIAGLEILRRNGTGNPQIIEQARPNYALASPLTQRNVLFGVLFGLAVGIGLVALRSDGRSRVASAARRGSTAVRAR